MLYAPLPCNKYDVIYADPPWSFYNDKTSMPDCTTVRGMRRPPYPVIGSEDLCLLPVSEIASENSILFMWSTDYHLERSMKVMRSWGFEYKTVGFVWSKKNKKGEQVCFMGAYTMKSGVELCLIGTRGKDAHRLVKRHNVRSYIESKRTKHSEKPHEVRERIVDLVGDVPKIELFARHKVDGWDYWGNEMLA